MTVAFKINYLSEARFGENISVYKAADKDTPHLYSIEGIRQGENISIFRSLIEWENL